MSINYSLIIILIWMQWQYIIWRVYLSFVKLQAAGTREKTNLAMDKQRFIKSKIHQNNIIKIEPPAAQVLLKLLSLTDHRCVWGTAG